jgi:ABC-type phosphate transport system substrate-binding protein
MAVVVDKHNAVANISSDHLAKIFREESGQWADGSSVVLVLHAASHDETETLERLNHMSPAEMKGFIEAHKNMVKVVASDGEVLQFVAKLPLEEGYLPH